MGSSKKKKSNLTEIQGIGPAYQKWFKEKLNVVTVADLAAISLSADEIEARMKADKKVVSRNDVEAWLAQAREFAAVAEQAKETAESLPEENLETTAVHNEASPQAEPPANKEYGNAANNTALKGGWKEFASFIIEFQERTNAGDVPEYRTRIQHIETDKNTYFPGIDSEQYYQWMLEQVGNRIRMEPEPKSVEEKPSAQPPSARQLPVARTPVKVEITQVRVRQPPQSERQVRVGQADLPFEGVVNRNEPFALEIRFGLIGEAAAELTEEPVVYNARSYVQDQAGGADVHLGDTPLDTLTKGKLAYTATLPETTLKSGTYRLFALVTLQAASVKPDFIMLPGFKVNG